MSIRKRVKANQNLYERIWQLSSTVSKRLTKWLLRSLLVIIRRTRLSRSGFVLPTVTMVSLVVILLTTALMLRSFDRSRNASSVRVNQAVLNAATPALARARAKIDEVFKDSTLPQVTPSDTALHNALTSNKYTFGDETRLKLVHDIDESRTIQSNTAAIENNETLTTAWKFPFDTDNNGLFDSYTLYGIYFRSPTRGADGKFIRARNPLEARTPPMDEGDITGQCAAVLGTSDRLVGNSGWYQSGNKLTKSFFVYTATVPITDISSLNSSQYEQYKGNKGFSALESQQDRVRIPLNNNAVWYEDDIEVSNAATNVRINGRVFTNSNLMVAGNPATPSNRTIFYQVSDPDSCYYEQENSKIVVGGNIANGSAQLTTDQGLVEVHRFQGKGTPPAGRDHTDSGISNRNKTTTQTGGRWVGYNNEAYSERIGLLVQAALNLHVLREKPYPTITSVSGVTRYPQEVKERFKQRFDSPNETKDPWRILREELETYFKTHTRRVPYAEVDSSTAPEIALGGYTIANVLGPTNQTIRPPDKWMAIEEPANGTTTGYTNLPLKFASPFDFTSGTMYLQTTEPTKQQRDGQEHFIGDRIAAGNNLPFFWPKYTNTGVFDKFFDEFAELEEGQPVKNGSSAVYWSNPDNGKATDIQRTRQSQLQIMPDLGSVERDGFWETEAAKQPVANENTGGLRVSTGAGIYVDDDGAATVGTPSYPRSTNSFLPNPGYASDDNIVVWPDSMPMMGGAEEVAKLNRKGDLLMRATAVYHHKQAATGPSGVDLNQVPIVCVSSYYDPTDQTTARNIRGLPDVSGISDTNGDGIINRSDRLADGSTPSGSNDGRSNNGVTYDAPYTDDAGRLTAVNTYRDKLNRQARAVFPTGRIVNELLRKALKKIDDRDDDNPRSLADNAAIDTAICAVKILDGTLRVQSNPNVPHGAIKEATFLDGRQVKSLNNNLNSDNSSDNTRIAETPTGLTSRYTLPLEQRQPLEIRVTELDLNLLRRKEIGRSTNNINNDPANDQEYLLPNSGIIYATRDDALPDLSSNSTDETTKELVSPTDFKLDSTRRPNGIRLINGSNLARKNFYRVAEKGLILATNLPTYIKGDFKGGFNLHKDPNPSSSTIREEFIDKLNEFDWNDFYNRTNTPDPNFACRQYQPGCADSGDQWRPATIISDTQTLLSNNFWDGFRNQGDYDLNNNQGNFAVEAHLKNGFWNNNFVTSADWVGSNGYPAAKNSYLTNGVTPIQRRANFPEYVMEICRKLPVSECKLSDWVVGYDENNDGDLEDSGEREVKAGDLPTRKPPAQSAQLGAGTTARPALEAADRRYARRLAFNRNAEGGLEVTDLIQPGVTDVQQTPRPLGINTNNQVQEFRYSLDANPVVPNLVNNALWFRTTNNTNGKPFCMGNNIPAASGCTSDDRSYTNDKPLYYASSTRLISPRTPEIDGVPSLNLPADNPASGYTICTEKNNQGSSKKSLIINPTIPELGKCSTQSGNPMSKIQAARQGFLKLNPDTSTTDNIVRPTASTGTARAFTAAAGTTTTFTSSPADPAQPVVNVIDINGDFTTSDTCTRIQLEGNENSIFVLRKNSTLKFGAGDAKHCGVRLGLNEVDPNNVFWAINGNVEWLAVDPNPNKIHEMAGTFITATTGNPKLQSVNFEDGGRLLGSNGLPSGNDFKDTTIKAIPSTEQPSLVPVLQIHSPTGTPGNSPFNGLLQDNWLQLANTTTANAAFITGDSPSRPNPSESGGGLHNLVHFLENWDRQIAKISGSFMQHRRSYYGSAPFNPVDPTITSASLFYELDGSGRALYSYGSDKGFRYRGGESDRKASFFMQPTRAYSFDVALLSQSPDLFAQKFTINPTSRPSEYFREVGRNDPWIQTLLCAAQGSGTSYTYAIDASERPTSCPSLNSYNDQQGVVSDSVTGG